MTVFYEIKSYPINIRVAFYYIGVVIMGRKRINPEKRRKPYTIVLPEYLIKFLKEKKYLHHLIERYIEKLYKEDKEKS